MRRMLAAAVAFVALPLVTAAQAAAAGKRPITAADLWAFERVGTPVLSADGTQVAYTVTTYDVDENKGNADVWLLSLSDGHARRLTTSKAPDGSPAWSPDGRRLAFVSKREGDAAAQVYVLPLAGGEAERVTELPLGVSDVKWFPDGKRLAFVSHVIAGAETPADTKKALEAREKSKLKAHVTENRLYRFWDRWLTDDEYPHLFVLDLETRRLTDLLPGSRRYFNLQSGAGSFDIAPDGRTVVFEADSSEPPYRTLNADLFAVPAGGGEVRNLTASNPASDTSPVFSPDGQSVAYGLERKADGWPDYTRLAVLDLKSGRTRVLTEGWDNSPAGWTWSADGRTLVFSAEVRARANLYAIPAAGGTPREIHRGGTAAGAQLTRDGRVVFQRHDLSRPPELAVVGLDGSGFRFLTHVNDARLAALDLGAVEELTFKGAGGDAVQMFVVFPPGLDAGRAKASPKKHPLVQLVHGGPVGTFGDGFQFRWSAQVFAAPGYVVAMVNFHGSSSFGQPFLESILGAPGDKPFTDVMNATDHLIAQGYVDPQRLAAAGGSYGGYLVDWIAGHTDRFKALVSHAGVYSLPEQFASDSTFGRHHSYGGYPFTNLASLERSSPNRFAAALKTPMLIIVGERDFRVPATQGLELFGVLQAKGVPARLVDYPDENHWVLKPQNSRHWYGEVLGWLERWLK